MGGSMHISGIRTSADGDHSGGSLAQLIDQAAG
jgi:hypothetical protein